MNEHCGHYDASVGADRCCACGALDPDPTTSCGALDHAAAWFAANAKRPR